MSIPAISALLTCLMVIMPTLQALAEEPPAPPPEKKIRTRFFPGIPPKMRPSLWPDPSVVRMECPQPVSQEMEALDDFYIDELAPKILPAWDVFANEPGSRPIVKISLSSTGELREVGIVKPSGKPEQDNILVEEIRKRSPFPALPEGYPFKERVFYFSYDLCRFQNRPMAEQNQLFKHSAILKPWANHSNQTARSHWNPPITPGNKLAIVTVLLDTETGTVLAQKIHTTSCDPDFDNSAMKAVEASNPFSVSDLPLKKLPPEFPKDIIVFQIFFKLEYSSMAPWEQQFRKPTRS